MENKILISFLTIYHYNFEHRIQSLNRFAEKRNGIDTTHESPRYVTF